MVRGGLWLVTGRGKGLNERSGALIGLQTGLKDRKTMKKCKYEKESSLCSSDSTHTAKK